VRVPNGAGTHVHTAAIRAEIDGYTDNVYLHNCEPTAHP
jgi:hypothetical protein